MENSRFRCVFLDNYYLLINKKYLAYIKQHLKEFAFLHKSYATAVAMATMTFQLVNDIGDPQMLFQKMISQLF
jgi:hypothetical protein